MRRLMVDVSLVGFTGSKQAAPIFLLDDWLSWSIGHLIR